MTYMVATENPHQVKIYETDGITSKIAPRWEHVNDINGRGDYKLFLMPPHDTYPAIYVPKGEAHDALLRFLRIGTLLPVTIRFYPRTGVYVNPENGRILGAREQGGGLLKVVIEHLYDADASDPEVIVYTGNFRTRGDKDAGTMLQRWKAEAQGTDLEHLMTDELIDHVMTTLEMLGKPNVYAELYHAKLEA